MPETGASGSVGAPLEQSEGATRQQVPPYGLPSHLFRFALELAFAPRWRGRCLLHLIIVRSFLALEIKNKKGSRESKGVGIVSMRLVNRWNF
jgi:hypothetical protein